MGDLISIIVPVYNSAPYLEDCVKSVQAQTYPHFELLFIDDGSQDGSREICEAFGREDERIRVIPRPHQGVSAARNAGIRAAQGKYVFFLDSDDLIHPQLLEALYELQEKNGTVIGTVRHCSIEQEESEKSEEKEPEPSEEEDVSYLENQKALKFSEFANVRYSLFGMGGKLILREAARNIEFHEKLTHGEDTLFIYQLLADGADVSVLCQEWYFYRRHGRKAGLAYSARVCRSRYYVLRYICNQEIKSGRVENAICWENYIVKTIMEWYEAGKAGHDSGITEYVKTLADREKERKIFSAAAPDRRIRFYLMFYCYPVLKSLPVISGIAAAWTWICARIWEKIWQTVWGQVCKGIWDILWVKRWKWIWKWRRLRNAVWYGIKHVLRDWVWNLIRKLAVKLKWKIKRRITLTKMMARELWAKAWRIRNKVWWAWVWFEKTWIRPWKKLITFISK